MLVNWQTKQRNNNRIIKRYVDFLPEVEDYDQKLKLITEIGRLSNQNQIIDQMIVKDSKTDYSEYTIKITAQWIN